MKERLKAPELRFPGFTDDWEERKFSDFTKLSQGLQIAISDRFTEAGPNKEFYITNEFLNPNNTKKYYIENPSKNVIANKNDILMTRTGNTGKVVTNTKGAFHNNFFKIDYDPQKISKLFLYFLLTSIPIQKEILIRAGTSTIPDLNHKDFYNIKVYLPIFEEQQRIGSFFKQLDDTIALHQRKLDLLKEQKKGYLQKMFPKNGAKVPELRFAGFADDWEERKLSSISERVTRKNKNNESTLPLTISAQDGLVDQNDFFNKQVASRDVTGYFLVKNGEFAYNKSYSNGYPWGAIKRLDKYDMGVLSTLYIVFRPTEINSQFLVSYYDTTRWYREVSKIAAEGARNHGLLNIAPTDFFNTLLVVPKLVDEQEKIGSFFKQLDNTIALHQRKLDLLKEQKKGFLQKMFV